MSEVFARYDERSDRFIVVLPGGTASGEVYALIEFSDWLEETLGLDHESSVAIPADMEMYPGALYRIWGPPEGPKFERVLSGRRTEREERLDVRARLTTWRNDLEKVRGLFSLMGEDPTRGPESTIRGASEAIVTIAQLAKDVREDWPAFRSAFDGAFRRLDGAIVISEDPKASPAAKATVLESALALIAGLGDLVGVAIGESRAKSAAALPTTTVTARQLPDGSLTFEVAGGVTGSALSAGKAIHLVESVGFTMFDAMAAVSGAAGFPGKPHVVGAAGDDPSSASDLRRQMAAALEVDEDEVLAGVGTIPGWDRKFPAVVVDEKAYIVLDDEDTAIGIAEERLQEKFEKDPALLADKLFRGEHDESYIYEGWLIEEIRTPTIEEAILEVRRMDDATYAQTAEEFSFYPLLGKPRDYENMEALALRLAEKRLEDPIDDMFRVYGDKADEQLVAMGLVDVEGLARDRVYRDGWENHIDPEADSDSAGKTESGWPYFQTAIANVRTEGGAESGNLFERREQ